MKCTHFQAMLCVDRLPQYWPTVHVLGWKAMPIPVPTLNFNVNAHRILKGKQSISVLSRNAGDIGIVSGVTNSNQIFKFYLSSINDYAQSEK